MPFVADHQFGVAVWRAISRARKAARAMALTEKPQIRVACGLDGAVSYFSLQSSKVGVKPLLS